MLSGCKPVQVPCKHINAGEGCEIDIARGWFNSKLRKILS